MTLDERRALHFEVEQFLFHEADVLDRRSYDEWLTLLTDDIHYWMPIRRTTMMREIDREFTKPGEMAFFDDNLEILQKRIVKLTTSGSWAEDPPSRTRHFVSNVRIVDVQSAGTAPEVTVELNFHLYRTRMESEEDSWIGRRVDVLRRVNGDLRLAKRHIFLEQTVILAQNMSNLF